MTKISADDVRKLAKLSRLRLEEEEVAIYQKELEAILAYVEQLQSVDVEGEVPTSQVTGLENVVRQDEPIDYGVTPDELLKVANAVENRQFKVKRMVG